MKFNNNFSDYDNELVQLNSIIPFILFLPLLKIFSIFILSWYQNLSYLLFTKLVFSI